MFFAAVSQWLATALEVESKNNFPIHFRSLSPVSASRFIQGCRLSLTGGTNPWALARFPEKQAEYLDLCHRAGQTRPTLLHLQYGEGDYNYLKEDKYGEHVFPLQAVFLLSDPNRDFGD